MQAFTVNILHLLLCIGHLSILVSGGRLPGCLYSEYYVPFCSHGPWGQWNCNACPGVAMVTRHRDLCCENDSYSVSDCYKACSVATSEGIDFTDCTVCHEFHFGQCYFSHTHENMKACEFSSWLPWDCTKCPDNWPDSLNTTVRKRAICCEQSWTGGTEDCMKRCGRPLHTDTDADMCVNVCPLLHGPSTHARLDVLTTPQYTTTLSYSTDTITTDSFSTRQPSIKQTKPATHDANMTSTSTWIQNTESDANKNIPNYVSNSETSGNIKYHDLNLSPCFVGPWKIADNPEHLCKLEQEFYYYKVVLR